MEPCPTPEDLIRLAEGDPRGREALLAHLESCAPCRAEAALAARELPEAPRARLPWRVLAPLSAAAALLLALLLPRLPGQGGRTPERTPAPETPPAPDSPFAAEEEALRPAGRSGWMRLRPDARVRPDPDGALRLLAGELALACREETLRLRIGDAELVLEDGLAIASLEAPARASFWLDAAHADASIGRIALVRGKAVLRTPSAQIALAPGQEASPAGELRRAAPLSWDPESGWRALGAPASFRDAELPLPAGAPDYAWEARVRRSSPGALLEMRWESGGRSWRLPLGRGALGEPGGWVRLEIRQRAGWTRLSAAGRLLLELPADRLGATAYPAGPLGGSPALAASGGAVELEGARWRPLP